MTRVASYSHNQSLIQGMLRNQAEVYRTQQQMNTGKKAQDYKGLAPQAATVVNARAAFTRMEAYKETAGEIGQTLALIDLQTGAIADAAESLKKSVLDVLALGNGQGFEEILEADFKLIVSALNTRVGNGYLFAGSQSNVKPFTVSSLDELAALPDAKDAFANDKVKSTVRLTDTFTMEYGVVADDLGATIMQIIKEMKEFHDGPDGPVNGNLTPDQEAFLEAKLAELDKAVQGVRSIQTANGLRQSQIDDVTDQLIQQRDYLELFVSDIEDVNMAEAITRFNADQAALEVSYKVVSLVSQLNLTKYI